MIPPWWMGVRESKMSGHVSHLSPTEIESEKAGGFAWDLNYIHKGKQSVRHLERDIPLERVEISEYRLFVIFLCMAFSESIRSIGPFCDKILTTVWIICDVSCYKLIKGKS
jgi:hypothetical protein